MRHSPLLRIALFATANASFSDVVANVNAHPNATWIAADSGRFASFAQAKALCGTFLKGHPQYTPVDLPSYDDFYPVDTSQLDESLDLRTAHPECKIIAAIRDQSACGSCWAFSSVESFGDRRCIANGGNGVEFSALDVATNADVDANGCKGGQPAIALK
jgi:cathepsin B